MVNRRIEWMNREKHSRANARLFLLFLVFGLIAGLPIGRSLLSMNRLAGNEGSVRLESVPQPTTGQNSWLILGVDDLDAASPRLESAWLALFFPGKPEVTLLPVFPVPGETLLEEQFALDRRGLPVAAFMDSLHAERLWWTGYVVLDTTSLTSILDLLNRLGPAISREARPIEVAGLAGTKGDGITVQQSQTELLASPCRQSSGLLSGPEVQRLVRGISPHLRTDLDLAQAARAWPLTEAGRLMVDCEFPLLGASR